MKNIFFANKDCCKFVSLTILFADMCSYIFTTANPVGLKMTEVALTCSKATLAPVLLLTVWMLQISVSLVVASIGS